MKSYGANASESPARRATRTPAGLCLQAMLHREARRLNIQGPGTGGCRRDTGRGNCYLGSGSMTPHSSAEFAAHSLLPRPGELGLKKEKKKKKKKS